ncbi:MAG: hypothetical protein H0V97_11670 [Actinobacteria bacterium]|nr:hypothetical protein [Actinomycetota bacterium]
MSSARTRAATVGTALASTLPGANTWAVEQFKITNNPNGSRTYPSGRRRA